MKPPGTVQLSLWVPRDLRELVRVEAKARKVTQSKLVERAVRELVRRLREDRGMLFGGGT